MVFYMMILLDAICSLQIQNGEYALCHLVCDFNVALNKARQIKACLMQYVFYDKLAISGNLLDVVLLSLRH